MTLLLNASRDEELLFAAKLLDQGQPVALPTETVYGLAADGFNEKALARVFSIKARPHFDPLILHVLDFEELKGWVKHTNALQKKLADAFWPGPLTILFEKTSRVPDLCTSGLEWVAVRSPRHPVFRKILELRAGKPLAAPSANRFTSISPTKASDVLEELAPHGLEAVVDGGLCNLGIESTVLKVVSESEIVILRLGSLSIEEIKNCVGPAVKVHAEKIMASEKSQTAHAAPGQLERHYSPRKILRAFDNFNEFQKALAKIPHGTRANISLLEVFPSENLEGFRNDFHSVQVLSVQKSWAEAAQNLFGTLRDLDKRSSQEIWVILGDETSLGAAINDRLRRASKK